MQQGKTDRRICGHDEDFLEEWKYCGRGMRGDRRNAAARNIKRLKRKLNRADRRRREFTIAEQVAA